MPPKVLPRDAGLERILERVRQVRNFDFRNYKRATLQRRVDRRMQELRCRTPAAYLELLDREPGEVDRLIASMLIKLTCFFRDEEVWRLVRTQLVPQVLQRRRPGAEVRVWSAGCATGEEAYSLAICFAEALGPQFTGQEVKVFGTDVDEAAVAHARRGVYEARSVEGVEPGLLNRWFTRTGEGWAVRKEVRRAAVFGVNNLVSDAPVSRIDLLMCRNVFIYMDADLQKRVLTRFHFSLRPEGVLVLGKSELIPYASRVFEPLDVPRRVYRKNPRHDPGLPGRERLVALLEAEGALSEAPAEGEKAERPGAAAALQSFYRQVLDHQPCPVVVTAADGAVSLWNRAAGRLWGRSEAEVFGKRLSHLALPGLTHELLGEKSALVRNRRSEREWADVSVPGAEGGEPQALRVLVSGVRGPGGELEGLLYVAHELSTVRALEGEVGRLQDELRSSTERLLTANEELQSANEELETTNEELQSANEELQTTNEELQSTNEELETTNEELQSTNAELDATNRELAHRTQETDLLSVYQRTIIRTLSAAVVVLDPQGRVGTWNLAAERLLGLAESEVVGQALWTLAVPALSRALLQDVRRRLAEGRAVRLENEPYALPHGGAGRATIVATPLLGDGVVLGAVLLFEDTTRVSLLQEENTRLKGGREPGAGKAAGAPRTGAPAEGAAPKAKPRAAPPKRGKRGRRA
jgi:two-component system CheB/CheR fusion protein